MRQPDLLQVFPRPRQQGRDPFDGKHLLRQHAEDRRLVAAAGTDLERFAQFSPGDQDFDHARDHKGLRDGLAETEGQSRVVVGAVRQGLFEEDVARNHSHCMQYPRVAYAQHTQALDHARAGAASNASWWPLFGISCALMGFVWAITLLTYLLPPSMIWGGLLHGTLTPNQTRFLLIASTLFTLEFAFARHLFCRFGCAVGLFQSLAWMANPKGMVVAFARERARDCKTCDEPRGSACDNVCPMRLNPRNIKRMMFSCVQCGQCLSACDASQSAQQRTPTLEWRVGVDALRETLRQRQREQDRSN